MFPGHLSGVELLLQKDIFLSPYFFRLMQYMRRGRILLQKARKADVRLIAQRELLLSFYKNNQKNS